MSSKQDYPLYVPVEFPGGLKYEQPTGIFINNEFVKSKQNSVFETICPFTEKAIASVYEANEDDVDVAVKSAQKAFEESDWNKADPATRAKALNELANAMEEHAEIIAHIDTLDNGKSISNSRGDVALAISCLRSDASYADKQSGEAVETGNSHFSVTRKEPLGVCGQIIPWNFPILMFSWKIGPALATGNTVVLKTSETTPLSALFVCKLIKERNIFPPGVLNVVNGFGKNTGNAITEHPDIQKVAFTGSTPVGKMIYKKCSDTLKKCTLELGGKSAHIVFDDANFDTAVESVVSGIFYNSGEVCSAGSRLYIQEGAYDKFIEKFVDYTKNHIVVGDPFDEKTLQGAQNSESQLQKILDYVKIGTDEGAKLLAGGEKLPQKGYFVQPTIFGDVKEDMRIVKEEIFGPVITVSKFKTADEAVKLANASEYGLAAGIQSSNINTILNVSRKLKAGTVWVNTYNDFHPSVPFGGYDQSGIGRELGSHVYDNYIQTKSIRIKLEVVN